MTITITEEAEPMVKRLANGRPDGRPTLLEVRREIANDTSTEGVLVADGWRLCHTLEPRTRRLRKTDPPDVIARAKAEGPAAIPAGRYRVMTRPSARFGRELPRIEGVPGFEGVLIHAGNSAADTRGCVLVGRRARGAILTDSRVALAEVCRLVREAEAEGRDVLIDITDP